MAKLLVRAGAKGFDTRKYRMDLLRNVIDRRDLPAVNALLETGIRVYNEAFCAAVEYATPEIVKVLIKGGADVNGSARSPSHNDTLFPLHLACDVRGEP